MSPRTTQAQTRSNSLSLVTNEESSNLNSSPDTLLSNLKQLDFREKVQKTRLRPSERQALGNTLFSNTNQMIVDLHSNYDPHSLQCNLKQLGYNPGPITPTTYRVYLKKLEKLQKLSSDNNQNIPQSNSLLLEINKETLNKKHKELQKTSSKTIQDQLQSNSLKLDSNKPGVNYDLNILQENLEELKLRKKVTSKPTKNPLQSSQKVYSAELQKAMRDPEWINNYDYAKLESNLIEDYINIPERELRGGSTKSFYTYLLLDPRITLNLPLRASKMKPTEIWKTFITSIFYVGKGKGSRMYAHLFEAFNAWDTQEDNKKLSGKIQQIIDIWKAQQGAICIRIFENILSEEAYTREAAIIQAIGLSNLQNLQAGQYHGTVKKWDTKEKCYLGVYLLYKAMQVFLNLEEKQLRYADIKIKKQLSENILK